MQTALPTALVGSIALSLTAAPAAAEMPRTENRPLIALPQGGVPGASRVAPASVAAPSHTVTAGDTVSGIAARHGLRTADVLAWNALEWSSLIRPGQVLALSGESVPTAPAAPTIPAAASHTVVAGDTLWSIARGSGVSLADLLAANGLTGDSIIYPGQRLGIPSEAVSVSPTMTPAAAVAPAPAVAPLVDLDAEQIGHVRTIIDVGRSRGVSDRGISIALATAMVESWIRNLDWGDRDSLGLFQQRPSQGWGEEAEVRDTARAAAVFFGGPRDPNGHETRGLLDIPGWESMAFGDAAQAVQLSAYPERYGPWEAQATSWVAAYG